MALTIASNKTKKAGLFAGVVTAIFAIAMQPILASGLVGAIVINEVMPNPVTIADSDGEWVEIHNPGSDAQDVSDWTLGDGENNYTFPSTYSLAAGQYYVICNDIAATDAICDAEWSNMALANGGEVLTLSDSSGSTIDVYEYTAAQASNATEGQSLEIVREDNIQTTMKNSSDNYGPNGNTGTPGAANTAQASSPVMNQDTGEGFSSLQAAIDDADTDAGDTILLKQDLVITSDVDVTKAVTINGDSHKITADFVRTSNSNNSVLSIGVDNVTVTNITLDGVDPVVNKLHGVNNVGAQNVLVENVTTQNFRSGVLYVSSTGTIRNITTSGSIWSAINVDRSNGAGMPGSTVTIEGSNSHAENSPAPTNNYVDGAIDPVNATVPHLFIDDATDAGIVVNDTGNQYKLNEVSFRGGVALVGTYGGTVATGVTEQDVYANTYDGTNGWVFGSGAPYDTPFEFTTDESSIGTGSLVVGPVQSDEDDKFIAYYFTDQVMKDIESFSYDFKLDSNTPEAKANEFYLNVYTQFKASGSGWYDCRYNIVPTIGSQSSFTTVSFDPAQPYDVTQHSGSPSICPSRPLAMGANTTILYMALNVGDTSANDVGYGGFYDNVQYRTVDGTTVYDFEYVADPNNENHLNISVNKFHNRNGDRDRDAGEEWLDGWTLRLYKEAAGGDWELVDTKQSRGSDGRVGFKRQSEAGTYHICEVKQLGWTQIRQVWSGTVYHVATDNESPNASEEGPYCATVGYDDTRDRSAVKYLGNRYNDQNGTNHLNLSGLVFNNLNGDRDRDSEEAVLSDWTLRVYKEDATGYWGVPVAERTTRASDNKYAIMLSDATAGIYHVCQVNKPGWQQVRQDWGGTPYHLVTENLSGASDEGEWCSTVVFDDSGDRSNAKYFGNQDIAKPAVNVVSPAGGDLVDSSFSVSGTASDNQSSVNRVEYKVTKITAIGGEYVANVTSGTATGTENWTFDLSGLDSGFYRLKVQAFDAARNWKYDYNDVEVDADAPDVVLAAPADGTYSYENDGTIEVRGSVSDDNLSHYWLKIKGPNGYNQGPGQVTSDEFGEELLYSWNLQGLEDGDYEITFSARDKADNKDGGSKVVRTVTVDNTAPAVVIVAPAKDAIFTTGPVTVSGTIDDLDVDTVSVTLNGATQDADVQPDGSWETSFAAVPVGTYEVVAVATDAVGNSEPVTVENVTVNSTPPSITPPPTTNDTQVQGTATTNPATTFGIQSPLTTSTLGVTQLQQAGTDTSGTADSETDEVTVAGATDENAEVAPVDAVDEVEDEGCTSFFGLCWYWWIAIGIGAGVVIYAIVAPRRAGGA